ncbi:uncharacterized protein TM35_000033330 [Trypanosoma theileri]|uniref:Uncharacterized protein n=1 Tax=Trypanosoma theileri TaxID=67003 RepID=A0A1X0P840_9TRYP|nr:uncharacterized protein TM35_000033330 [Trypanosoma theileri]ORC92580.1 hypothetical protein TM35_000033330 [Trypanosoma theileri]
MSDNEYDETPSPVATVIVRRQCFPRVPPELLLREHAARFRLTGLTMASLLEAVTPRVYSAVPPFVAQTDLSGEVNHEFIDVLLKEMRKMPTVSRENIKESSITRRKIPHEEEDVKGPLGTIKSHPKSLNTTLGEKVNVQDDDDDVPFIFEEASPSRITATGIVRRKGIVVDTADTSGESISNPRMSTKLETTIHDSELEEREILWGYDSGAVVHVTLRTFALDLQVLRQYETLQPMSRRRRRSSTTSPIQVDGREGDINEDASYCSSSILFEREGSTVKSGKDADEHDDMIDIMKERAPYGVSLLGYHPVGPVCCLVYDTINDLAISGGADGSLFVWDLHQRYRAGYRDRHVNEEELRQMRPTQQFSTYVKTRRLIQRLRYAHNGAISTLSTHCELLLSGGVDGTVKVWQIEQPHIRPFSSGPPQYVERQVFRCRGWVRHIWCASERNVQGDDIYITSESGDITCLKGSTASQQPIVQSPRGRHNILLDALRKSGSPIIPPYIGSKRRIKTSVQFPTLNSLVKAKKNEDEGILPDLSPSENKAFKLLNKGLISRALRKTRTLQTISEEARLVSTVGNRSTVREESTSAITRIIPLAERNLFITVGYSSIVRFLDMSRRSLAGVVEHPYLSAAREKGKGKGSGSGNHQPNSMKKESNDGDGEDVQFKTNKNGTSLLASFGGTSHGPISGKNEALRFIDVLYVSSCDYLILLDNRNTVFVWDYAEKKILTSWVVPQMNEGGKNNVALSLLPCGTRHYENSFFRSKNRIQRRTLYRPQRRIACYYQRSNETERDVNIDDDLAGVIRIPFFVVCSKSLELCDVVVESHARLEFQAHQDNIVGIFIRPDPLSSPPKDNHMKKETSVKAAIVVEKSESLMKETLATADNTTDKKSEYNEEIRNPNVGSEKGETKLHNNQDISLRFQKSFGKTEDSNRLRVLSCSVDGTIRFWGNMFEPLRSFDHKSIAKKNARYCTTTIHKPVSSGDTISPFDAPPRILKDKRTGEIIEVENDGCDDTTSFYYSSRWNLAITGHDDGSIRCWPCNQQMITFVWHKRIHRNAVSGLVEARIGKTEKQRRTEILQGKSLVDVSGHKFIELLATVSYDGYLAVWERPEQAKMQLFARTRVSSNELLCVAFEEINELFIVGDNSGAVSSWNARDLEPRCKIPSRPTSPWRPVTTTNFASTISNISPSGTRSDDGSAVSSIRTKRVGHKEAVTALLVDGNLVFSGGEDGRVFLWDLNFGVLIREYFLLHDTEAIGIHRQRRKKESIPKMYDTAMYSNESNSRIIKTTNPTMGEENMPRFSSENVTCIVLLKRRRGDFLVATREGWIYHFKQNESYPFSTYEHNSSIRCMCVLQEGWESEEEEREAKGRDNYVGRSSESRSVELTGLFLRTTDLAFEVALGCENGKIAVIREAYFSATV